MARGQSRRSPGSESGSGEGDNGTDADGYTKGEDGRPDGYWILSEGSETEGALMRRKTKPDDKDPTKTRAYYILHLHSNAEARLPKKPGQAEGDVATLQPGQVLQMDERSNLEGMAKYAQEGKYVVKVKVGKKRKIPGTKRTVWDIDWFWKLNDRVSDEGGDEIPF